MIIIPAIDLIDGKCVRLTQGKFEEKKEYSKNPLEVANYFEEIGAKRIHIVDLDGAKTGESKNRTIIKNIKKSTGLTIETGGGIRREDDIKDLLDAGIDYLILGTILAEDLALVESWMYKYQDNLIAGIDVKDNFIRIKGWKNDIGLEAIEFGRKINSIGFTTAVYTDIMRDGVLKGANILGTIEFAEKTGLNVILSGGISDENDIREIIRHKEEKIRGIIVGKAYYEGRVNLKKIIKET